MDTEFSRIITMLRKEKKLSQKRVAKELAISQGLLSHYEKGVRECGLDFIVKIAEYYNVSCDYLLGRTEERNPEEKYKEQSADYGNSPAKFHLEQLQNALSLLFGTVENNRNLETVLSDYLTASVYQLFRILYSANPENPQELFSIDKELYSGYIRAFQNIRETELNVLLKGITANGAEAKEKLPVISEEILLSEYPDCAAAISNVIKITENNLKKFSTDKP